ncbi:CYTH domain-containing protein [Candidatus Dojkabacteria bacterium]|nr:CYTH domain-containing protein [Candidatus Dojkabacteria bacterium]
MAKFKSKLNPEIEAKFYDIDKDVIRDHLKKHRYECKFPERKMRRVIFDHRENSQVKAHYIRVRDEGEAGITMSAKIHAGENGRVLDQEEEVVKVSDFENTVKILKACGLEISADQETLRETWIEKDDRGETEVSIDTWPMLKPLIEIETYSEDKLKQVARELGFDWKDRIITSVVEIYMKEHGWDNKEVFENIRNLRF